MSQCEASAAVILENRRGVLYEHCHNEADLSGQSLQAGVLFTERTYRFHQIDQDERRGVGWMSDYPRFLAVVGREARGV